MGYVYLLCVALMFSFGGTCVKLISPYFNASWITFFRFFIGVVWLLILKCILRQPFQKNLKQALLSCWKWILFGAFIKWMAYLTENYALSHGLSYGNIVTQPAQTLFLTLVSVLCFKEKLSPRKGFCIFLCIGGVLCISLNGRPLDVFFKENLLFTGLFILSGICAGCHVLSQKMVAGRLDIIDSNLAIFTLSGLFSLNPGRRACIYRENSFYPSGSGLHPCHPCLRLYHGNGLLPQCQSHPPGALLYGSRDPEHDGRIRHSLGRILLSRNGHWLDHRRNSRFYDRGHRAADEE